MKKPNLFTQTGLNYLVADLDLAKEKGEVLYSRLKELSGRRNQYLCIRKKEKQVSQFFNKKIH